MPSCSGVFADLRLLMCGIVVALAVTTHPASPFGRPASAINIGSSIPRRGNGKPHHYSMFTERAPCPILSRRYVSSPLEGKWLEGAAKWKAEGNGDLKDITPYCNLLTDTMADIKRMLALIETLMADNTTLSDAPDADTVLSYFRTTMQCGPYTFTQKEHIESLVGALRHPFSIKCPASFSQLPEPTSIFDRGYVLLASWKGPLQASKNKYYLDAGAGVGYLANANQYWMLQTYEARGLPLDRALFWEASVASGSEVLQGVPPRFFPAFAFYNIPAPSELTDGRNPLNVITRLARPEDFVSIKLDIDQPSIEDTWLRAILGNGPDGQSKSRYAQLIDELFWEHHFNFLPMMTCCWASTVDYQSHLVDSMQMFIQMRDQGIRSHYWQ